VYRVEQAEQRGETMNTASEIIRSFRDGQISLSECWDMLNGLRLSRSKPHDEPVLETPPSKVYEPLSDAELKAIEHLQGVSFGAASGARRFAHQVKDAKELTARQREYLRLLVYKYRRQIFGAHDTDTRAKAYIERMKARNE
jgi:hypothetical protein